MTFVSILILLIAALLARLLASGSRSRLSMAVLALSALAVYWLQPALPVRYLAWILPTLTLALAAGSWLLVTPREARGGPANRNAALILLGVALLVGLARLIDLPELLALPTAPPLWAWAAAIAALAVLGYLSARFAGGPNRIALWMALAALLLIFIALKAEPVTLWSAGRLRALVGQQADLARAVDLRWLGYSYLAFRLIHTYRDRQNGRLPVVSLGEYLTYAIFFPAFTAGPIDRLDRFIRDLRAPLAPVAEDALYAGRRLAIGLFKKFVIADTLALIALSAASADQARSAGWLWLLVYAFALQIWLDFSGYTDIAIGLGALLGVRLPENFNRPYLRPNLTQFWNNWHMTLTNWFRAYFFNPLTRALRAPEKPLPVPLVILITQVSTMLLIGLWHGIALNFVFWGLWHGLGLFLQNRWTDFIRPRLANLSAGRRRALDVLSTVFTFHFVALGWVWFALPDAAQAGRTILRLLGLG